MSNIGMTTSEQAITPQLEKLLCMRDLNLRDLAGPARRWKRNANRLASDLGGDLSFAEQQLAMRAAMLAVLLEDQECRVLLGEKIAIGEYTQMIAVQKQLLVALRLKRAPRDVSPPSVADYIKHINEAAE
jgi:hypothetical protein